MFTVYVVCAAIGATLVALSLLGGHHGDGGGHDADAGHDAGHEGGHDGDFAGALLAPLLSLRFWTYTLLTYGLSGLLFTTLAGSGSLTNGIAVGMGLGAGILAVLVYRSLKKGEATSATDTRELAGKSAEVLVAIRPGQMGRVRVDAKGETLDLLAQVEGDAELPAGSQALIVGTQGDTVMVIGVGALESELNPLRLEQKG